MEHELLGWAINKNGETVCVSDVPKGIACDCHCPYCNAPLLAKKGKIRKYHFAHAKGLECQHGYEASIHLLAKEVFQKTKTLCLPRFALRYECKKGMERILINNSKKNKDRDFEIHDNELIERMSIEASDSLYYADDKQKPPITFDNVLIEQFRGDVKPDAIAVKAGHELFVEFFFSHAVDNEKYLKLVESKSACVEIDLSNVVLKNDRDTDYASMGKYIADKSNIRWINYPDAIEKIRKKLSKGRNQYVNYKKTGAVMHRKSENEFHDHKRIYYSKGESLSLYHQNCEYILNRVEKEIDDVCDYVKKLRTEIKLPWKDVHDGNRQECRRCSKHIIMGDKVFCERYKNYI